MISDADNTVCQLSSACDTEQTPLHRSVVVLSFEGIGVSGWRLAFSFQQPCTLLEAVSNDLQSVNGTTWLVGNSKVCALTTFPTSLTIIRALRASLPDSIFLLTVCLGV